MRRLSAFAALFLAGCASTPAPTPPAPTPVVPAPVVRSDLIGLTSNDLVQRLGTPVLQIREGQSIKLQFRSPACVLDAYLYTGPGNQGAHRVTHVDTRLRSGVDVDQRSCVAALSAR